MCNINVQLVSTARIHVCSTLWSALKPYNRAWLQGDTMQNSIESSRNIRCKGTANQKARWHQVCYILGFTTRDEVYIRTTRNCAVSTVETTKLLPDVSRVRSNVPHCACVLVYTPPINQLRSSASYKGHASSSTYSLKNENKDTAI